MSMIRGITTCKLCGKEFTGPSYTILGRDRSTDKALVNYVNEVSMHFIKTHERENEAIQYRGLEFLSMLRLLNFRTTDAELQKQVELLRWQIHQQVIPIRLRDAKLSMMAKEWGAALAEMVMHHARAVIPAATFAMFPEESLEALSAAIERDAAERTIGIMRELRDLYEEPNKFETLKVVEVPKTAQDPPESALAKAE